jgi:hypothetical protein
MAVLKTAPLIAALAVCVLSCSKDTRQADTKNCVASAYKLASEGQLDIPAGASAEDRHDRIGAEVAACMDRQGYRHDNRSMTDERCVDDVDYDPYCYERRR